MSDEGMGSPWALGSSIVRAGYGRLSTATRVQGTAHRWDALEGAQLAAGPLPLPQAARPVPAGAAGRQRQTRGDPGTQSHGTRGTGGALPPASQPGCRSQEVGVATARPHLDALVRVLAVAALAFAGLASVRPI